MTETTMDAEAIKALRKAFDKKTVGKLPKPYKKDSPKGQCAECGGYHGLPALHLDYVGHAAVTDRLLSVDPEWNWRPMATTPEGVPMPDSQGNLWIWLTVRGVTRPGVGDGNSMKERIGDAIRNAAMRFGVALDLWSKEELESAHTEPTAAPYGNLPRAKTADAPVLEDNPPDDDDFLPDPVDDKQVQRIAILSGELGLDRDGKLAGVAATIGRQVTSTKELTKDEATKVIKAMQTGVNRRKKEAKAE
jgi:hypothetical protein